MSQLCEWRDLVDGHRHSQSSGTAMDKAPKMNVSGAGSAAKRPQTRPEIRLIEEEQPAKRQKSGASTAASAAAAGASKSVSSTSKLKKPLRCKELPHPTEDDLRVGQESAKTRWYPALPGSELVWGKHVKSGKFNGCCLGCHCKRSPTHASDPSQGSWSRATRRAQLRR